MKFISSATVSAVVLLAVIALPIGAENLNSLSNGHPFVDMGFKKTSERRLIVGGEVVPNGAKPWATALRTSLDGDISCSGSLISPTHVLTGAHCLATEIRWATIGTGSLNSTKEGEHIRVVSIMPHPAYTQGAFLSSDLMVVELEKNSTFTPIKLAAADDSDIKPGEWATAMGWGAISDNQTVSHDLRRVNMQLISDEECLKVMEIDDTMVCAGGIKDKGDCYGDSGGPLIVESPGSEDVLIGVVSWTGGPSDAGCAKGYPSAFMRVSKARTWIESMARGACFK
ncbi:Serine protease [Phytophthora megakarya]|uniref:Serine protease n=1 Tax=Phytophthora megakarya TaxID=4795 RepID=A0A225V9L9_9STRA|nr:Serine protease [Phytophthora megakarya]